MRNYLRVFAATVGVVGLCSIAGAQLMPGIDLSTQGYRTFDTLSSHLPDYSEKFTGRSANLELELSADSANLQTAQVGRMVFHERLMAHEVTLAERFSSHQSNLELELSADSINNPAEKLVGSEINIHEKLSWQFPTPHD